MEDLMKKITLVLMLTLFTVPAAFAGLYDSNYFSGQNKAFADQQFEPFAKLIGATLNSGLGDPMNIGTVKIGAEIVATSIDKEGYLASAPVSFIPVPYLYGGVSLFDFLAFARVSTIPAKSGGKYPVILGGGLGKKFDFTPLFTLTPVFTYHRIENLELMKVNSFAGQLQFRINLLVLTPFVNFGVSHTRFNTDYNLTDAVSYNYSKTLVHTSFGAKLFFFVAEVAVLPERTYTIGASFGF